MDVLTLTRLFAAGAGISRLRRLAYTRVISRGFAAILRVDRESSERKGGIFVYLCASGGIMRVEWRVHGSDFPVPQLPDYALTFTSRSLSALQTRGSFRMPVPLARTTHHNNFKFSLFYLIHSQSQ